MTKTVQRSITAASIDDDVEDFSEIPRKLATSESSAASSFASSRSHESQRGTCSAIRSNSGSEIEPVENADNLLLVGQFFMVVWQPFSGIPDTTVPRVSQLAIRVHRDIPQPFLPRRKIDQATGGLKVAAVQLIRGDIKRNGSPLQLQSLLM